MSLEAKAEANLERDEEEGFMTRIRRTGFGDLLFVPLVLAALFLYLAVAIEFFLTTTNLTNILLQATILGIIAFGVTFVILAGELDLSVGTGMALVSVVTALVARDTGSIVIAILAGLGVGLIIGILNGLVVTRLEVPSFIATLGMMVIAQGAALALSDGAVIAGLPDGLGNLANTEFLGLRLMVWLMFAVFAVLYFIQSRTVFGIRVFAVGGNRDAARLSGIPVEKVRFLCFVISGLAIAIAGIALTARVESGQPNAGGLIALTAVAAVVVGGTSIFGGRGSVARTLWGVLLIATLENGLDLEGVDPDLKQVIIGVVFIVAASTDFVRRQLRRRRSRGAVALR